MNDLIPEHPTEAGLEANLPDASHIEGAALLANEARHLLRAQGFTDQEIEEWANTYIADERTGDVSSFVEWISEHEKNSARPGAEQ